MLDLHRHPHMIAAAAIIAVLLSLVFICMCPTTAQADESYDRSGARSMLSNVNNLRANDAWITLSDGSRYNFPQALSPYSWDNGLEQVAMLRAKEIAQSFSHTRPNGKNCFSAYTDLDVSTSSAGENIAMGYPTVASVMDGWAEANEPYDGQGHRRNMLSTGFTCIGIGHYILNGVNYWVQEFGSESGSNTWKRLSGGTALSTMKTIVNEGWDTSDYAIVATNKSYHDALAASGLAGIFECPVMLTEPTSLSNVTKKLLISKKVKNVIVVGGMSAVSDNVLKQIKAAGVESVERISGGTAASTARNVYKYGTTHGGWGNTGDVILATSRTYQDALSIAPYAYAKKVPVFLTSTGTKTIDSKTSSAINSAEFSRTLIIGGSEAVATSVEKNVPSAKRLSGGIAYSTSKTVAEFCLANGMEATHMGVTRGDSYQDALAGAALLGKKNSIIVLADNNKTNSKTYNVEKVIDKNRSSLASSCYVFGGTSAIGCTLWNKIIGM